MTKKELTANIRDRYRNAKIFIERGYNHKDTSKIEYNYPALTREQAEQLTDDMYEIYKVATQLLLLNINEAMCWYNEHIPKDETPLLIGRVRSDMYTLSHILLSEGRTLTSEIGSKFLDEATEIATRIAINESED